MQGQAVTDNGTGDPGDQFIANLDPTLRGDASAPDVGGPSPFGVRPREIQLASAQGVQDLASSPGPGTPPASQTAQTTPPGAPGPIPMGPTKEMMQDPEFQRYLGFSGSGSTGPDGKPYMLGSVPVIDPVPSGVVPKYNPDQVDQEIANRQLFNLPIPTALSTAQKLYYENGILIGNDNIPRRVQNGVADPARIAQEAAARASGAAAGEAPYKTPTEITVALPGGGVTKVQMQQDADGTWRQVPLQQPSPSPSAGTGPGATSSPGGAGPQPPAAAAPGPVTPAGVPLEVPETIGKAFDAMRDKYDASQTGLQESKMLQNTLEQIGNVGPGTNYLGQISAILQRAGVPAETISASGLPNASDVVAAQKLSTDLLLDRVKGNFQRVTNMDLGTVKGATPSADMPLGASRDLLGNVIIPQFWRETKRYEDLATDPQYDLARRDPVAFNAAYANWNKQNPLENFMTNPARTAASPTSGAGTPPAAAGPAPVLRYDPVLKKIIRGQ